MLKSRLPSLGLAAMAATLVCSSAALADPADYRFEAVQAHVKASSSTAIAVKLIHLPDGKAVPGAVIFSQKLEMPMQGMAPMTAKVASAKSDAPGEYRFQGDLSMGGNWVLTLQAKVQGESGTVTGAVPFMAMP